MGAHRKKVCRVCGGDPQSLRYFYKAKSNADGHSNACKECVKKAVRANQDLKAEVYKPKKRIREQSPAYRAKREAWRRTERGRRLMREARKAWAVTHPEKSAEIQRKHWKQTNEKRRAARLANHAPPPGEIDGAQDRRCSNP